MSYEKGQSLIELIVAIGVSVILVSALAFLIFNSYTAGRLSSEISRAGFLAEEGLEAARSIRDNNWQDLTNGDHGLSISGGNWQFFGTSETIDGKFTRIVQVQEINPDRKKITSKVNWQFDEGRPQEVKMITYLTNWQRVLAPPGLEILRPTFHTDIAGRTTNPQLAYDETNGTTFATTVYKGTGDSIIFHTWQTTVQTYNTLVLKYRYQADGATDDTYALAYSLNGGSSWIDLIPSTSAQAPDTTVFINLDPFQDLSQLQVKIYTTQEKSPDNQNIYTRDIWTEGSF